MNARARMTAALLTIGLVIGACTTVASPSLAPSQPASASGDREPAPSPTAEPTADPPTELTWTAEPFPGEVHGLIQDQDRLVAVGRDADGLASWTSTDGAAWTRHDVPDPTFIADLVDDFGPQLYSGTQMGPMTRLGDTLFSIGTFLGPNDFYRPVGWRSSDGASWEFIESESEFYEYGAVTDLETSGDTLLAARTVGLTGPVYSLWTWTAETSWRESSVRSVTEGIATLVTALDAAVGDGAVLVVGEVAVPMNGPQHEWPMDPVGWRSDDGEQWDEVTVPDDVDLLHGVAPAPDGGFSVLGTGVVGTISAWHTAPDGSQWTGTDLHACPTPEACDVHALTRAGDWLVTTVSVEQRGRIWLSRDGMNWVRQQAPAGPRPEGPIAELDGTVFVFAIGGSPEQPETILLRGEPPG